MNELQLTVEKTTAERNALQQQLDGGQVGEGGGAVQGRLAAGAHVAHEAAGLAARRRGGVEPRSGIQEQAHHVDDVGPPGLAQGGVQGRLAAAGLANIGIGPALEAQSLDEVGALLGRRPTSWSDADLRLEEFVQAAGPESDAALVGYFHRQFSRHEALLEGALREFEGVAIPMLD